RSGSAPSRNRAVLLRAEAGLWLGQRDDCVRRGRRVWRASLLLPFGCKNYTSKRQKCKCEFHKCEFPTYLIELLEDRFGVRRSCVTGLKPRSRLRKRPRSWRASNRLAPSFAFPARRTN